MSRFQESTSTPFNGGLNSGEAPKPAMPKTYLVEAILVTCLCCLPFGILGIVNATKVEGAYFDGNYPLAEKYSRDAKKWSYWGAGAGLAVVLIYGLIILFAALAGALK